MNEHNPSEKEERPLLDRLAEPTALTRELTRLCDEIYTRLASSAKHDPRDVELRQRFAFVMGVAVGTLHELPTPDEARVLGSIPLAGLAPPEMIGPLKAKLERLARGAP